MARTRTKATKEQMALMTLLSTALYNADPSVWRSLMGPSTKAREILDTPGMADAMAVKIRGEVAALEDKISPMRVLAALLERVAEDDAAMEPEVTP